MAYETIKENLTGILDGAGYLEKRFLKPGTPSNPRDGIVIYDIKEFAVAVLAALEEIQKKIGKK